MPNRSSASSINSSVASRLDEVAQILEEQGANVFRVGAYRRPIDQVVRSEGLEGLNQTFE